MRRLLPLLIASSLAGAANAQDVEILPGYSGFRAPDPVIVAQPIQMIADWLGAFPEGPEGAPKIELTAGFEGDRFVMVLTDLGGGDDSVSASQRRYEFVQADGGWMPVAFGHRQKCWRGAETENWVPGACP